MAERAASRILKGAVILGFICLNLAIASPADARLRGFPCIDPETGGTMECCESCWFLGCDCEAET